MKLFSKYEDVPWVLTSLWPQNDHKVRNWENMWTLLNFKQLFCPFNAKIIRYLYVFSFVMDSSLQILYSIFYHFMINFQLHFRPMRPFIVPSYYVKVSLILTIFQEYKTLLAMSSWVQTSWRISNSSSHVHLHHEYKHPEEHQTPLVTSTFIMSTNILFEICTTKTVWYGIQTNHVTSLL